MEQTRSDDGQIRQTVKDYILEEFLPGENPEALDDSTRMVSDGILDSISTIRLVSFLEERYGVRFEAHEMSPENLDTLPDIARTVRDKLGER